MTFFDFFTDPILQAPTLGSMLMCLASGLVGVLVFLRKKSLIGEALSHAAYPGVVISACLLAFFSLETIDLFILAGAFCTALIGLLAIEKLERLQIKSDAALCFVLSLFFGIGITFASYLQTANPLKYQSVQIFLYGQAATMVDVHVVIYGLLSLIVATSLFLFFRPIEMMLFDRGFARSLGMSLTFLDGLIFFLLVLAIIIGIRSVGVVLMVGMLIAPAVTARQFSDHLHCVFIVAGIVGAFAGFLGNYLSIELPLWGNWMVAGRPLVLPTGPMILLVSSCLCVCALLFSPKKGLFFRWGRVLKFRHKCVSENVLKHFWKKGGDALFYPKDLIPFHLSPRIWLIPLLKFLTFQGWLIQGKQGSYQLSEDGRIRAAQIVRLHRLWEVYLVSIGQRREKVHHSAEEMEHILTPEMEKELTALLKDPKHDPHAQPIPSKRRSGGVP